MTSQSWKMLGICTKIVQYKRIKKKYTVTLADIWQSDPQILQPTWTRSSGMKMLDFHNKMKGTRCKKEKNQSKYFKIVAFQLFKYSIQICTAFELKFEPGHQAWKCWTFKVKWRVGVNILGLWSFNLL